MWIRMRFDIGWRDLFLGLAYCLIPKKRSRALRKASETWSRQDDFLITLSVRSAFDLLLRAMKLPGGSEVLLSALTVPDMVRIVEAHGLVAVPVDTDQSGNVDSGSLRLAISSQSRMIVVAHLFGGCARLDEVLSIAKEHNLLVVEDCAQRFSRVGDSGHPASDVAMYSFGPIKTATALGGGVVRVKSSSLRERMAELLKTDPVQSPVWFSIRLIRFSCLKLLSGKRPAVIMRSCAELLGYDFDSLANSSARGFSSSDPLPQFRRQPSSPLLRLLCRRWRTYDFTRIDRRIQMGRLFDSEIGREHIASHSHWVCPVFVHTPTKVRDRLREAGFDATCQTRMAVVHPDHSTHRPASATHAWEHVVFLPWYPDMPDGEVRRMACLLQSADIKKDSSPSS